MEKKLRRRFVLFSMLVIMGVLLAAGLVMAVRPGGGVSHKRLGITAAVSICLAAQGGWLLSKAAVAPIKRAWQRQLDFTADASHELRTPLAVMQTNLELVLDSPGETVESQLSWLQNIQAEQRRMARLLEDLLTLSRADSSQQALQSCEFLLDQALEEAAAPFLPVAGQKGVALRAELEHDVLFCGDRKRLIQLAVILLDNAVQYTSAGSITLSLAQNKGGVCIRVTDTGCGIAREHQAHLFERFYRAPEARSLHKKGYGLGLAIAGWIAREHGGSIHVRSSPGAGAAFSVQLPAKK